jgi:hypothetical protein
VLLVDRFLNLHRYSFEKRQKVAACRVTEQIHAKRGNLSTRRKSETVSFEMIFVNLKAYDLRWLRTCIFSMKI